MPRDHLSLFVNGRSLKVGGDDAFLTLADFLRRRRRLVGTKIVCAEGDCGACAVLVGRVRDGRVEYAAVASCIQLMFQLDATHVVTVEGLAHGGRLNAIQESLVRCQGTQCGFCTPGFVVSLYDALRDGRPGDAESMRRAIVGNLCRCTGYDSIVRAAVECDRAAVKSLDVLYPTEAIAEALAAAAAEDVRIDAGSRRFFRPATLDAAVRFRAEHPDAIVVAGGTDVGVQAGKRQRTITMAMSVGGLAELGGVSVEGDAIHVGASATLSALERVASEHLPELGRFLAWFGSPLIKDAGTIAGNLVTGSPIGDTIPALTVLDAVVGLVGPGGARAVPMGEWILGYRKTAMRPDELVVGVRIPIPPPGEVLRIYKVSRRRDLDISTFGAAIRVRRDGGTIAEAKIAFGGVGPTVLRMTRTEAALRGRPATLATFEEAGAIAGDEVAPISDVRGSEAYRRALARNVLVKFWHEVIDGEAGRTASGVDGNGDGSAHLVRTR